MHISPIQPRSQGTSPTRSYGKRILGRRLSLILQLKNARHLCFSFWPRLRTKQRTNENRAIWLVYRTDTNAHGFWLVKRRLWRQKLLCELSRNQPILRFDVILQNDWLIEQCPFHIRVFFGGKTKRACFNLFICWLIKQITNTYRNYFSPSHENRSIFAFPAK